MPNPELIKFIQEELALGASKDAIVLKLTQQGWQQAQIDEAFTSLSPQLSMIQQQIAPQSPDKTKPTKSNKLILLLLAILLLIIMAPVFFVFTIISSYPNTPSINAITPFP